MKKSQFFSIYVLIHGLVLALVVGMGVAAFSISVEGLLILPVPTTATTSANTRGAMVAKLEAEKDKTKKEIKQITGGCEIWDTGTFWRVKRWGNAVPVNYDLSMTCDCPSGFIKVAVGSSSKSISSVQNGEWYHHYYSTNTDVNNPTKCTYLSPTSNHNLNINQVDFHTGDYMTDRKHCYKLLCGSPGCDCAKEPYDLDYYTTIIMSKNTFFNYAVALMNRLIPSTRAKDDTPGGCGLVMMYQRMPLIRLQTANIQNWVCVNTNPSSTITGWDNNN